MNYREFLEHRGIDTYDGAGQNDFLVTCPFHDDTSPSLEVHKRKGMFYCFGCKEHGSFAELLAEIENISLTDARRMVLTEDDVSSVLSDLKEALDELDDEPAKLKMYSIRSFRERYPSVLDVPEACDYVSGRGISERYMRLFDLRFGVGKLWQDRIIIPIHTPEGKLLTYAGRTVKSGVKPKTRKIKGRSPRTVLFGLPQLMYRTKKIKIKTGIVVEGEFDAIYLQSLGLPAVSTMGTMGLTGEQLFLLKKHFSGVVYSYDGDDAGRQAQERAVQKTRAVMPVTEVHLPDGEDPNSLWVKDVNRIYRGLFL